MRDFLAIDDLDVRVWHARLKVKYGISRSHGQSVYTSRGRCDLRI